MTRTYNSPTAQLYTNWWLVGWFSGNGNRRLAIFKQIIKVLSPVNVSRNLILPETLSVGAGETQEVEGKSFHNLAPVPSPRTKRKTKGIQGDQNMEKILQEFRSEVIKKDCEISLLKKERSKMKEIVNTEIAEIRDIKNALSQLSLNSSPSNEEIQSSTFVNTQKSFIFNSCFRNLNFIFIVSMLESLGGFQTSNLQERQNDRETQTRSEE